MGALSVVAQKRLKPDASMRTSNPWQSREDAEKREPGPETLSSSTARFTTSKSRGREVIEFGARTPVQHNVKDQAGKYLSKKLVERALLPAFCTGVERGSSPVGGMVTCDLAQGVTWLCGALSDVELMKPLSDKLIERTLHEFEAHIDAHESRLWRTNGATS